MGKACRMKLCPYFKSGKGPKQDKRLRLHNFPVNNPELQKAWEDWVLVNHGVERGGMSFTKSHGLCSAHFTEDCYRPGNFRLKDSAMPSIAPELTIEYATKAGVISKPEDFPDLLARIRSAARSGSQEAGSASNDNTAPLHEVHVRVDGNDDGGASPLLSDQLCGETPHVEKNNCGRFVIHKRKRRKFNGGENSLPVERVENFSTPARGNEELGKPDCSGESSMSETDSSMTDSESESDPDTSIGDLDRSLAQLPSTSGDNGNRDSSVGNPNTSFEDSHENDSSAEGNPADGTPPVLTERQRRKRIAFLGDITAGKFTSPRSIMKILRVVEKAKVKCRTDRHNMKRRQRRTSKKIKDLQSLVQHLTKTNALPVELGKMLEEKFSGPTAELLTKIINGSKAERKGQQYDPVVRKFAMTLNFHSPAAYRYVRTKLLGKNLPHPRTLSKWYSAIDAKPGFTEESKQAIKVQVEIMKKAGHTLRLALSHDEMAIRLQATYCTDGTVGGFAYDGYASAAYTDDSALAKNAWVIMATAINADWKLPLGYFFIASMDTFVRTNLIKRCLEWLYDTGAVVDCMTFDGLLSNICTAESLGARLQPGRPLVPYFPHPVTAGPGETQMPPIYVMLDAAHMVKLWRNVFGSGAELLDAQGRSIKFDYVTKLHELQQAEGLRAGNRLTNNHVHFEHSKQKVRYATQLLSKSVAHSIEACRDDYGLSDFINSEGTVKFLRMADAVFDVLNSTNRRTHDPYKKALGKDNIAEVRALFAEAREYIRGLKVKGPKDVIFTSILDHKLKTGFLGFLFDMDSVEGLYERLLTGDKPILNFLPTYKLSQDHLEMFFGRVRSQGGWNNNPSTTQFMSAYKRLLVKTELKDEKRGGNCWPLETIAILHVSAKSTVAREMERQDEEAIMECDHNYARSLARTGVALSTFVGDVVEYIAGFVVRRVNFQHDCKECSVALFRQTMQGLVLRKNRGGLKSPSADVLKICRKAESLIRSSARDRSFLTTNRDVHVARIFRDVVGDHPTIFSVLDEHVLSQAPLENHKFTLLKAIIKKYIVVRMCWDVKKLNSPYIKPGYRSSCNKSVLFQHQ